jgi:2',3'-cyclic-nucleotide 2'-phosphodiesterase
MTRILFFWDIYWRTGRNAVIKNISKLRDKYRPDFILANIDNLSSGRWAIEKHVIELEQAWFDAFSSGDHIFDNEDMIKSYLSRESSKIILPANLYTQAWKEYLEKGYKILEKDGKKVVFIHLLGQVFIHMGSYNPFLKVQEILEEIKGEKYDGIFLDFHKEASSEIAWMFHIYDGKLACICWTHTHIQTNDDMISKKWTGFITDVWMNWPLISVIWAHPDSVRNRFLTGIQKWKIEQQTDPQYVLSAIIVDVEWWVCTKIEKLREIGSL